MNIKYDFSCPVCGMKPKDFLYTHKIGCEYCYLFLEKEFKTLITVVQDNSIKHFGKKSKKNVLNSFFNLIINNKIKSNPELKEECEDLRNILNSHF